MSLTLIAALDLENGIGKDNQLLWHLPDDFLHFKQLTMGHCVIMGRRTWESLPRMLPNRTHIIVSKEELLQREHCVIVSSVEEAILQAYERDNTPFVIGGGEIYRQTISLATTLELTRVQAHLQADVFFPQIDTSQWELVKQVFHSKDERHLYDFYFETYIHKQL